MAELINPKFSSLEDKVSDLTLKAVLEMGFETMTDIQAKTIPIALNGSDIVASAKTGSGKTLAFLLPAIELLHKLQFRPRDGTAVIVISPTRELAMQMFGVLTELMKYHSLTRGLIMGRANRKAEAKKLSKGVSFLIATPGRLLDHLQNTPRFLCGNLQCLIIDEADRILDIGFEEEIKKIIDILPKIRQTLLFSATLTKKTEDLVRLALKEKPTFIGVEDKGDGEATVDGLTQGYVICPADKRFLLLYKFLKNTSKKKVMVFFSSCMSVKYHSDLLNYIDVQVSSIYGKQKQAKRAEVFFKFNNATVGTLLCTDVAARGLDIPLVDWIVQFDPPNDPKEYIHRVGRTARGSANTGRALLFLQPEELSFLKYLNQAKVPVEEYNISWTKVGNIQSQLEKLLTQNNHLRSSARDAFKAYVHAYQWHHLKQVFNINTLDLADVARSFGLLTPPEVLKKRPQKRSSGQVPPNEKNTCTSKNK